MPCLDAIIVILARPTIGLYRYRYGIGIGTDISNIGIGSASVQ